MDEPILGFHTPLPGKELLGKEVKLLRKAFITKYRTVSPVVVPSNVPTACVLKGRKYPEYLQSSEFMNRTAVFFYMDDEEGLHQATPFDVVQYLSSREPWEDYDICLFDETLDWCVGITHNDDIIVVN